MKTQQLLEELKNVSDLLHAFSGYNEHTGIQGKKNLEIAIRCVDTLIDRVTGENRGDKNGGKTDSV